MALRELNIRISATTQAFSRAMAGIEKDLNRFARQAESAGMSLSRAFTLPLGAAGVAAVRTFAQFDKLEKGLAAVTGSAAEGARQMESLLGVVKDTQTTLDLKNAAKVSLQLQGVGVAAANAERLIRQLGIAATATGATADDVGEVGRQLSQSIAMGSVKQEELNVLLERLPALARIIKEEFGVVTAKGIRDAGISAAEFVQRLTEAAEADTKLQAVQGGLSKAIESFGVNLQIAGKNVGSAIAQTLNLEANLSRLSDVLFRASMGFKNLTPEIQGAIVKTGLIATAAGPALLGLGGIARLMPILSSGVKVLAVAFRALTGPIGLVVSGVVLVGKYLYNLYQTNEVFQSSVGRLWEAFKGLGSQLYSNFTPIIRTVGAALTWISDKLASVGINTRSVAAFFAGLANAVVASLTSVINILSKFAGGLGELVAGNFSKAGQNFKSALGELWNGVTGQTAGKAFLEGYTSAMSPTAVAKAVAPAAQAATQAMAMAIPSGTAGFGDGLGASSSGRGGTGTRRARVQPLAGISSGTERFGTSNITAAQASITSFLASAREAAANLTPVLTQATNPLTLLGQQFETIDAKAQVFGKNFDATTEKITAVKSAMMSALEQGFSPTSNVITAMNAQLLLLQESLTTTPAIFTALTEVTTQFGQSFVKMIDDQTLSLKGFAAEALKTIRQVIGALIKEGVVAAVSKALQNPLIAINPALIPIVAAGAGALAQGAFSAALNAVKVPKLATGGLAYAPTLAMVGDNPGARSNPEVIAPLSKLQDILSSGSSAGYFASTRISGDDLEILVQRAATRKRRY